MFPHALGMILIKTSDLHMAFCRANEGRACDYRLYLASVIRILIVRGVDDESTVGCRKHKRMAVDEMPDDKKTYDINSLRGQHADGARQEEGPLWSQRSMPVPQLLTGDYVYWIVYLAYIWQVFVRKVSKTCP